MAVPRRTPARSAPGRDSRGRFEGYRIDLENVPRISGRAVRLALADPRRCAYRLAWTRRGEGVERVSHAASILRVEFRRDVVRIVFGLVVDELIHVEAVAMPRRRGARLLLRCAGCGRRRAYLYPSPYVGALRCAGCARLRWQSEGGATRRLERRVFRLAGWTRAGGSSALRRLPWEAVAVSNGTAVTDHTGAVKRQFQTGRMGPYQ